MASVASFLCSLWKWIIDMLVYCVSMLTIYKSRWSRRKNDNGRKWRAHRSFNPSCALARIHLQIRLGWKFKLNNFDLTKRIAVRYLENRNLLIRSYRRKKDWKDEDSDSQCPGSMFSVFRLVRVPVKKSGDNRSPQDDPFFFASGVALAWKKKRQKSLSLSFSKLRTESEERPDLV